jgi:hypothetical protein
MPKYHTRYVKEHYIKRDIKRELYEAFIEWCGERSINICLEKALNILRGNIPLNVRGNVAPNTAPGAGTPSPGATNPPSTAKSTTTTKTGDVAETHIWCRKKSEIQNLKGFLKWVDHSFELLDWWEEEDGRVCFETRRSPKERGRRRGGG